MYNRKSFPVVTSAKYDPTILTAISATTYKQGFKMWPFHPGTALLTRISTSTNQKTRNLGMRSVSRGNIRDDRVAMRNGRISRMQLEKLSKGRS